MAKKSIEFLWIHISVQQNTLNKFLYAKLDNDQRKHILRVLMNRKLKN